MVILSLDLGYLDYNSEMRTSPVVEASIQQPFSIGPVVSSTERYRRCGGTEKWHLCGDSMSKIEGHIIQKSMGFNPQNIIH